MKGILDSFSTAATVGSRILGASRQEQSETDMNTLLVVRTLYCLHTEHIPRQIFQHKEFWQVGDQSGTCATVCAHLGKAQYPDSRFYCPPNDLHLYPVRKRPHSLSFPWARLYLLYAVRSTFPSVAPPMVR
jgi:hypothetical protein